MFIYRLFFLRVAARVVLCEPVLRVAVQQPAVRGTGHIHQLVLCIVYISGRDVCMRDVGVVYT